MSESAFILPKVENALAALLSTPLHGYVAVDSDGDDAIYLGIEHDVVNDSGEQVRRALPCVECVCQNSQFDVPHRGSHIAQASVMVRANADDTTDAAFAALVDRVWNALVTDTITKDLSDAISDFSCSEVHWVSQSWQIVSRSWVAELTMEIHCAGRTIPDA